MKKIQLDVVFMGEEHVEYAVFCLGVMSRRNLYLKCLNAPLHYKKEYIKIKRSDTKLLPTESYDSIAAYPVREMVTSYEVGLNDSRISPLKDEELIKEIDKFEREYNELCFM